MSGDDANTIHVRDGGPAELLDGVPISLYPYGPASWLKRLPCDTAPPGSGSKMMVFTCPMPPETEVFAGVS